MLAFEQMNVKSFYQRHDLLQVYVKLRVQEWVEDEALSQVVTSDQGHQSLVAESRQ